LRWRKNAEFLDVFRMLRRALFLLLVFVWPTMVPATEPPANGEPVRSSRFNVTGECQMVVLPQRAALALLPDLVDDSKTEEASARLAQMIDKAEARLEASLVVRTHEGKKSMASAVEEMRYPTEFDPPHLPNGIPKDNAVEVLKNWPLVGIMPTAFETRDIGAMFEFEPLALPSDGRSIEVAVTAQHVRFLRWSHYEAGVLPTGERLTVDQPQFQCSKNAGTLRLRNGQRVLLGMHKVPGDAELMELFLLRVSFSTAE
jgi:hypothetical protein